MTHRISIIYQDDNLLVLDKPPGLVVDLAETTKAETLVDILRREYGIGLERAGIVHRLDKDTSGILLVAKTPAALENLQSQFKERLVQKEYLALVHGHVIESGRVEGSIGRNPGNREKFTVLDEGSPRSAGGAGKEAVTEYEPVDRLQVTRQRRGSPEAAGNRPSALRPSLRIEELQEIFSDFNKIQFRKLSTIHYNLYTLLRCKPKTGRTHQIRVHLKYISHPIVSDEKYAGRKIVRLDKRWCPRIFLHAAKIGFRHPVSGEWMELESPLPDDLKKVLSRLA